jgi:hypothetical protein
MVLNWFKKRSDVVDQMAVILSNPSNQEEFLGVKALEMPSPEKVKHDASRMAAYSHTPEYKTFAKEVWFRALKHLDAVMDETTSIDRVQYHRGAFKATLDLLRLSYQAKAVKEQLEQEQASMNAPLRR